MVHLYTTNLSNPNPYYLTIEKTIGLTNRWLFSIPLNIVLSLYEYNLHFNIYIHAVTNTQLIDDILAVSRLNSHLFTNIRHIYL